MSDPRYTIIDSDTHISEPRDVWTSRVPKKWRARVPRVEWDEKHKEEAWFLGDKKLAAVAGAAVGAGWPEPFPARPPTYADAHPASYDASARLRYMDENGIYAQVLYPNLGGFGSQAFLKLGEPELMLECVRAYNDFQIDWISPDPKRFIAILATPFWDVEASVKEIHRCAARGHRGVLFTGAPHTLGQPYLGDRHWDPVWAAAQDTGLPVSFHIGSGNFDDGFVPARLKVDGVAVTYARLSSSVFLENGIQLADLLLSGVLPRFPALKFVSVESGIGWIPFLLESVDYHFRAADIRRSRPEFELLPSDYFRRQVYACYWFEQVAPQRLLDQVGVDNVLFETDFPHPTCLYGNIAETIEKGLGGQTPEVRRKILWENAAALYQVEAP